MLLYLLPCHCLDKKNKRKNCLTHDNCFCVVFTTRLQVDHLKTYSKHYTEIIVVGEAIFPFVLSPGLYQTRLFDCAVLPFNYTIPKKNSKE